MRMLNQQTLEKVETFILAHQKEKGVSPSYRQIMHETGMTTLSAVFRYVNALEKMGRITRTNLGNIETPSNLKHGGTTMIPLVGSIVCGAPNIGVEEIEETYAFPTELFGDGETTLKRFFRKGGKIILHPENKTMKDIITDHCEIQGILVSCIKMY